MKFPREIKALLFAVITLTIGGSFTAQWVATGSIEQGAILAGQILLMLVGIPIAFFVLLWIGFRIFK